MKIGSLISILIVGQITLLKGSEWKVTQEQYAETNITKLEIPSNVTALTIINTKISDIPAGIFNHFRFMDV